MWHTKKPASLCWGCKHANADPFDDICPWFKRQKPVPDWTADKTNLGYFVRECPRFEHDDGEKYHIPKDCPKDTIYDFVEEIFCGIGEKYKELLTDWKNNLTNEVYKDRVERYENYLRYNFFNFYKFDSLSANDYISRMRADCGVPKI